MLFHKLLIIIYYVININEGLDIPVRLKNKYSSIKKKILNLWKGPKGEELNLDINEIEYPRGNETLRNIHEKLWHEYYECLKKRYASIGKLKTLHPIALTVLEGSSVTMTCSICISPNDLHTIESVTWFYRNIRNIYADNTEVDITENSVISTDDRSLTLYNTKSHQEGLYWCKMVDTISAPYYLHIADETEPTVVVRPNTAPNSLHPEPPTIIPKYGLMVFTSWTAWTSCSVCDKVGVRIRHGHCTFSLLDFSSRRKRENDDETISTTSSSPTTITTKDDEDKKESILISPTTSELTSSENSIKQSAINVLTVFQNKMSCRSWFTPKEVQDIPEIKNRKTEIMKKYCKVKCQRDAIFEIRDKTGRILESANNSAGVYSTIQGIPEPRPSVQRVVLYRKHGKKTKLTCPGNLNTDIPITWRIGNQEINPETIKEQSNGRIRVDYKQRLIFKKLRYGDKKIYSCWQRNSLAGTIRLEVSYDVFTKFNHRVMIISGCPIISVMIYVLWRAWRGRNRFTKRIHR